MEPLLVLLVHPREYKKSVGTARLIRLSIPETPIIVDDGFGYDQNSRLKSLMEDPRHCCLILYPSRNSINLSESSSDEWRDQRRRDMQSQEKRLVIFIIDGTWPQAKHMIQRSQSLRSLPQLSFNTLVQSIYEFRRQPKQNCLSSIEAVGVLIEHLKKMGLCHPKPQGAEIKLLDGFKSLIQTQLECERLSSSVEQEE
jgi:DTW domain-containing protein YfiP